MHVAAKHVRQRAWLFHLKEPTNCLSHFAAGVVFVFALQYVMRESAYDLWRFSWLSFYAASFVFMYFASALYHGLVLTQKSQSRVLQRIDHAGIFLAIAGSNAPLCMITLYDSCGPTVMLFVTGAASAGITYSIARGRLPRRFLAPIYVTMALPIAVGTPELVSRLPLAAELLLFGGCALYVVAAVVFATRRPNPNPPYFGFHELFHVLIMAASALHFAFMALYLLPAN
ncbi:MAG: hemolysin III family protein [Candidatus Ryanbacteria bacterium]|nr:hemolysin III family protein [Candidatus Ryanbacteria bacterium]